MKRTPHKYQIRARDWLVNHKHAALFLDPGLGKTSITLDALLTLKCKALVVAPLRPCYSVWSPLGEIGKWDEFKHLRVALLHGKDKDDEARRDADLYVVNYDGLQWLIDSGALQVLLKAGVKTLVFDELSKMKHAKSKRFKKLKPWLPKFTRRWGLTGSPAPNGLLDLFGQAYVLDLGASLGKYITHYRHNHFLPTGFGGYQWVPKENAETMIHKAMGSLALSMKAEDYLELPELVESNIWVDLPPKAQKVYKELESDLITQVKGETIIAANAAVASGKCRQVASGGLYVEDGPKRKGEVIHNEKTKALVDLVEELQGSPLLVSVEFRHDLDRIRKALGPVPAIVGGVSLAESTRLVSEWNQGRLTVLCGHPAAMAHGLNLQSGGGHHLCAYSPTWDFELYDQWVRRVWRQGQDAKTVFVHRILARKTVDEVVVRALRGKKRTQDKLFSALKEYAHGM